MSVVLLVLALNENGTGVPNAPIIFSLTGGYGSVIGAALGAVIFGVVQQGLFFIGVESSLFRVFLGVLLLLAVILNTHIRKLITGAK